MKKQYTQSQLPEIAQYIVNTAIHKKLCFHGTMGAGKTTLIKAIVKELGSQEEVSSPTFGLVNEYHKANGTVLAYHFDFYRLNDESEALDFGIEDYLYGDTWVFMEWPEKITSLLPDEVTHIYMEIIDEKMRMLEMV
ncbi:tRNA (adenosine(37)-N6)-threonylcarbamoyltransferase complex ATPase subunit type 1 TsaE [Cellulophaga sp. Hel_I_12]|uniref:tRNA (adenosine(37)-N6)-threonylcarbamoyltransferase complex ATPase subunit type 1 TsaE n=1 Tax=Cellulophaga sp. Hel_I_12 TaxID=1249972 RepID=UPI0006465BEC|nr:tRNA (adenosine(37)-N6)-threonylcarbamoyltransferase complex ATPase subunit type 1 TsaE [Cellulophaga sp. Hel_I_12]